MQREVWFSNVAWSYMPCHWKGFAVMAVTIFPTVAAIVLTQRLLSSLGYGRAEWLAFVIFFVPAWLFLLGVAKRHS